MLVLLGESKMNCTQEYLLEIVEKASTIAERLSDNFILDETNERPEIVNTRIERWCYMVAEGDWEKFKKRLAWDELDINLACKALSPVHLAKQQHLPEWVEILNESFKILPVDESKILKEKGHLFNPDIKPFPFKEVFFPFVAIARGKLVNQAGDSYSLLSDEAHASLEHSLLLNLTYLCSQAMELEFSVFRLNRMPTAIRLLKQATATNNSEEYRAFIGGMLNGGLLLFFQEYPVLARLVSETTQMWIDATKEFLNRLASDWNEIEKIFPSDSQLRQVIAVKPSLSDRHQGRSVSVITFASGLRLVYKPKDLGLEQAYFNLLAWINQHKFPLSFKPLKVINCKTYGWVEYVEHFPCKAQDEVKRYYQRAGALLCLVHVLKGTDFHNENLIAHGEHPVLIDLETLMHHRPQKADSQIASQDVHSLANQRLDNSVLSTGLLPIWLLGPAGQSYDVTGLGGISPQETPFPRLQWKNVNTDSMALAYEQGKTRQGYNVPFIEDSNSLPNDYTEEIVTGFREMYQFLMAHKEELLSTDSPLNDLAHQQVRFIFRPTRVYGSLLDKTLNPKFLRDGTQRSIEFEILSRPMLSADNVHLFWSLFQEEKQALEQMDVPLFTACSDSENLTIKPNLAIKSCFKEPIYNSVISSLKGLCNVDLEEECNFIRASLYSRFDSGEHGSSFSKTANLYVNKISSLTNERIVNLAMGIAEDLQKQAICSSDGSVTWIAPRYIHKAHRFQIEPVGYDLYSGCCGIALFLAALEKVTGGAGFRDLALEAIQPLRRDLQGSEAENIVQQMGIGGAVGCGSLIYSLVRISQFLEQTTLLENAKQLTSLISLNCIAEDKYFDLIGGAAGAILGLLALYNVSSSQEVLDKAISCGNHLLDNRHTSHIGYRAWKTFEGKLMTGASHGAAGIAYALLRLSQITGETKFREAAIEANTYERSVFSLAEQNWPDFRGEKPYFLANWCHGASGIGLARVGALDILDTDKIREDIKVAIYTTEQSGLRDIDILCCGNLGQIEFLFTAARKLSQPQLLEIVTKRTEQVVNRAEERGTFGYRYPLVYTPGFFQGTAGIGYELLRLAYPEQLPSVLLLE